MEPKKTGLGNGARAEVANAAVIDFGLTDDQTKDVLATALQLVDEQVLYPIGELLGTWWSIIAGRQWQENPLDDPHAMYCSSFAEVLLRKGRQGLYGRGGQRFKYHSGRCRAGWHESR